MAGLLFVSLSVLAVSQATVPTYRPLPCGSPPPMSGCLKVPPVVIEEVAAQCPEDLSECEKVKCTYRKSGWMTGEQIDKLRIAAFFEDFGRSFPDWQPAVERVTRDCLHEQLRPQGLYLDCPAYDIWQCTYATVVKNALPSKWSKLGPCDDTRREYARCPVCPMDCFNIPTVEGTCNCYNSVLNGANTLHTGRTILPLAVTSGILLNSFRKLFS